MTPGCIVPAANQSAAAFAPRIGSADFERSQNRANFGILELANV